MAALLVWYVDNTMRLTFVFTDAAGDAVPGATLTGTLRDRSGESVWTGSLPETDTEGTYQVEIEPDDLTTPLVRGRSYLLDVVEDTLGYSDTEGVVVEVRSDGA